ncbi:hypothetical protein D3C80_2066830 [compost metagenome]
MRRARNSAARIRKIVVMGTVTETKTAISSACKARRCSSTEKNSTVAYMMHQQASVAMMDGECTRSK